MQGRKYPEKRSEQENEENDEDTALPELMLVDPPRTENPARLEEPVMTILAPPLQFMDRAGSDSGSSVGRSYSTGKVQY